MVSWWISWEKAMRSMQPQHPGRKQLRKQTILQIVTSPEGAVSERHPTLSLAPENLGHVCRGPLSSHRFGEGKDEVLGGWSATRKHPASCGSCPDVGGHSAGWLSGK